MRNEALRIETLREWVRVPQNFEPHIMNSYDVWLVFGDRGQKVRVMPNVRLDLVQNFRQECMQVNRTYRQMYRVGELQVVVRRAEFRPDRLMRKHVELIFVIRRQ